MVIGVCDRFKSSTDLLVNPFFTSPLIAEALFIGFSIIKGRDIEVKGLFTSLTLLVRNIVEGVRFTCIIIVVYFVLVAECN
jgi:hypothetical protein